MPVIDHGITPDADRFPYVCMGDGTRLHGLPRWEPDEIPDPTQVQRALLDLLVQVRYRFFEKQRFQTHAYAVQPGDVVVELGAYLGFYSTWLARRVGPTGRVIAVEIIPRIHTVLQRNLSENFPQTTLALNRGVWDRTETRDALWLGNGPGGSFTHEGLDRFGTPSTIPSVQADTVDGILRDAGVDRVDLLILQLNGSEVEAVHGMDCAFEVCRNMAIAVGPRRDMNAMEHLQKILKDRGFVTHARGQALYAAPAARP